MGGSGVPEWPMTTKELSHTVTLYTLKYFFIIVPYVLYKHGVRDTGQEDLKEESEPRGS